MAKRRRSFLKITGIGCASIVLLGMLLLGILWVQYSVISERAVRTREELETAHPTQAAFTPPLEEGIPAGRMERFLAVRRSLHPRCRELSALRQGYDSMGHRVERMEGADDETAKREMKELVGESGGILKRLFRIGRDVAEFSVARNEALIGNEMGLGEYTWIYVITYYGWLEQRPIGFPVETQEGARIFKNRVRRDVRNMIQRHVELLEASREEGDVDPAVVARIATWREEVAALELDPDRIPFQDGLPEALARSLEPYREELTSLYCPESGELEIMRTEKSTIRYAHN